MRTYVITGASSFIGIALTDFLLSHGNIVYCVCRRSHQSDFDTSKELRSPFLHIIYLEMSQVSQLFGQIPKADVFIHLAWEGTGHDFRNDREIQQRNIIHSMSAVSVASQLGCQLFVEAGSQAEFGYIDGSFDETTSCHPETEYGRAKLEFGNGASRLCESLSMKFIHLRILSIFGETDHPWTLVMTCVDKMLRNEELSLSSCTQLWNFVYVADAVKQIALLCNYALSEIAFRSEIYLIASHDTRPLRSFVDEIYHLTHSSSLLHFGTYTPALIVSLNPVIKKTEQATGGFISDYTFSQVIEKIINRFNSEKL